MNTVLRFVLVLFLVNFIAAAVLTAVYYVTKSRIEAQERLVKEEGFKQVMPDSVGDRLSAIEENGEVKYWKVFKGADYNPVGYVFIAKKYGYSSVIESMVGMKKDGSITGVRILSQNETPGLGAKIVEVLSNKTILKALSQMFSKEKQPEKEILPYFTEQFNDRNVRKIELSKDGIQAITGATISSKAVVEGIKTKGMEVLGNSIK